MAERVRETINVNDFSSLIGSNLRSSINLQGHSNRKEDEELQEQIRCYRAEVLRKKELLNELLVAENEVNVEQNPAMSRASSFYGDLVSQYRTVADEARAENASLQVRIANLEKNASILAEEIKVKDAVVSEHKKQVEKLQENNVRQISLISSLRQSIKDLEMKADEFEQEYRERLSVVNERVEDSNLLKKNLEELQELCENKNSKIEELERELATTRQQLSNTNSVICDALEMRDQQTSLESITAIIRKIITERNQIEDELNKVKVEFADCDNERRAGRETIMRLVAEAESKNLSASANADVLVKQANDDKMRIQYLEQQVASLSSKASELQQDLDAALCDFDELKQQKMKSRAPSTVVDIDFQAFAEFREELAAIISHDFRFVDADRVTILRAIKEILTKLKVAEGNESGFDEIMMRAVSAEHKVRDLMEQLSQLQTQMEMNESRGDSFHLEYALFMTFIKKLNVILKLESIIPELGLDMNLEAIINRCELLNKKESEVIAEKSSQLNMLQRKHKRLKEELEGKELHLDMLRKKVSQLEEKLAAYIAKPPEVTEFEIKFRKSQKINERLRGQLGDARLHIVELKEEASKYKDAHIQSLDNNDKFAQLVQKIQELEKIKNKQAKQLAGMKQETEYLQLEAKSRIESREESLGSLAEEVRNTKMALDEVARREKQLQDFKGVVAKMVGLDVCQLSVPDYEIISRLERMVSNTMDDGKYYWEEIKAQEKKKKATVAW